MAAEDGGDLLQLHRHRTREVTVLAVVCELKHRPCEVRTDTRDDIAVRMHRVLNRAKVAQLFSPEKTSSRGCPLLLRFVLADDRPLASGEAAVVGLALPRGRDGHGVSTVDAAPAGASAEHPCAVGKLHQHLHDDIHDAVAAPASSGKAVGVFLQADDGAGDGDASLGCVTLRRGRRCRLCRRPLDVAAQALLDRHSLPVGERPVAVDALQHREGEAVAPMDGMGRALFQHRLREGGEVGVALPERFDALAQTLRSGVSSGPALELRQQVFRPAREAQLVGADGTEDDERLRRRVTADRDVAHGAVAAVAAPARASADVHRAKRQRVQHVVEVAGDGVLRRVEVRRIVNGGHGFTSKEFRLNVM